MCLIIVVKGRHMHIKLNGKNTYIFIESERV